MTKQESEYLEGEPETDPRPLPGSRRRDNVQSIAAGRDYLLRHHLDRHWGAGSSANPLSTACVLARLHDVPSALAVQGARHRISDSLDWLEEMATPNGGWRGPSGTDEVAATSWAIVALEKHGRRAPETAREWIRGCRREDGGFNVRPGSAAPNVAEITALAVQALGAIDAEAERFLGSQLAAGTAPAPEQLAACAALLDFDKTQVPLALLNQACQVTARVHAESAHDRALLLRCLLRLRLTRAWALADGLRAAQHADGSWRGPGDNYVATATAVSALALLEAQPGLYFGSDSPRPRRFREPSSQVKA